MFLFTLSSFIKYKKPCNRKLNLIATFLTRHFNSTNTCTSYTNTSYKHYIIIYDLQSVNCLLRWLRDKDDSLHGMVAGFLAGWSMLWYKSQTIALYAAFKLAEVCYS